MKIVFSRKGFDSSAGGGPSPLIDGKPVSIPIPTQHRSETTYGKLGLGEIVGSMSKGKYTKNSLCHYDPMFSDNRCAFGQTGAAQGHLTNQNVGVGDVFLFFGLFANLDRSEPHHRIFGYLNVEQVVCLGSKPTLSDQPDGFKHRHPHTIDDWNANNTLYLGTGQTAKATNPQLRLTAAGESVSTWKVPTWLRRTGLTYHNKANRWKEQNILQSASRGQEFVADITGNSKANRWLMTVQEMISNNVHQ